MIAANGVTARYLDAKGLPALRRVLRVPKHWDRIVELAAKAGGKLPSAADAAALDAFLAKRREADPEGFPDLSLAVVKLLGSGEYEVEVPGTPITGHFGLAVKDYTHSTAPNRRYPDLIAQRLLKAALAARSSPYPVAELTALARHCTEQEDNAAKVERQVAKSAAALLLASSIGRQFDGIVTGASDKGRSSRATTRGRCASSPNTSDRCTRSTASASPTPSSSSGPRASPRTVRSPPTTPPPASSRAS